MMIGMNASAPPVHARLWLRVEDYLLLDGAGAFAGFAKTELIDGEVFTLNAQHRPHALAKSELAYRLRDALKALGSPLSALIEASIAMPPHDAPEPDITLTDAPRGDGLVPLPSVALIVEIADSTRAFDLGRKAELYARHRVPEYWVIDLTQREWVRHAEPGVAGYARRDRGALGTLLTATTIAGLAVATDDLI